MDDLISDNECIICLDDFDKNKNVVILDCDHRFHEKCINNWFCFDIKNNKKDIYQYNACPKCNKGTEIKKRFKLKKIKLRKLEYERDKEKIDCCCVII